uniref:Uncharacterized protein n=1 Tax=Oscillatoriales cyanobacterium SpSt-402 TaxID=2282168 RepID=A0A832H807_9CYAN
MKLNYLAKPLATVGRWIATALVCVVAIAFVWQGSFISTTVAWAGSTGDMIASADMGDQVKDKVSKDAGRAKGFIRDTANQVERTANKNANRVENAADRGSFVERKAQRDRDLIERRAEEDAARTQEAVDDTKNVVKRAVDSIKDTFN